MYIYDKQSLVYETRIWKSFNLDPDILIRETKLTDFIYFKDYYNYIV